MSMLLKQLGAAVLFLVLVVLAINPWHIWMPTALWWLVVVVALIVFALFAIFIWREKARDEREALHTQQAGRVGFLIGAGVLVLGILYETHQGIIDWWLLIALTAMIFGKWISAWYSQRYL
jgi:cobalamin synthase